MGEVVTVNFRPSPRLAFKTDDGIDVILATSAREIIGINLSILVRLWGRDQVADYVEALAEKYRRNSEA